MHNSLLNAWFVCNCNIQNSIFMFQPPKKKGTKAAKGKSPTVVDGLSTEEMSKEQVTTLKTLFKCLLF